MNRISATAPLTLSSGDLQTAAEVLTATARQLMERGQTLWPPESLTPERLQKHYPAETWRVAWQGGQAVGTFCLLPAHPFFWPEDAPGEALYLHKLGVHPDAQGQGLAQVLLRLAAQETREAGRTWLKLDTAAGRGKLRALYHSAGFEEVDEWQVGPYFVVRLRLKV